MANVFSWPSDRSQIEFMICSNVAPLKIGLKTKDDFLFLAAWVEHHVGIAGEQSIFIADNGSEDQRVLDYYALLDERICVFQFKGLHNDLHDRRMFPELHNALILSSSYFQILDTDERLIWLERDHYIADRSLVDKLMTKRPMEAALGLWLSNLGGSQTNFLVAPERELLNAIQWGKSLFSTGRLLPPGQKLHNCQLPQSLIDCFQYTPQICVLHLKNFSREQRMDAARKKLIARRAVPENATIESILESPILSTALPGSHHYFDQLDKLHRGFLGPEYGDQAHLRSIRLEPDGALSFSSAAAEASYTSIFANPQEVCKKAFSLPAELKPK